MKGLRLTLTEHERRLIRLAIEETRIYSCVSPRERRFATWVYQEFDNLLGRLFPKEKAK